MRRFLGVACGFFWVACTPEISCDVEALRQQYQVEQHPNYHDMVSSLAPERLALAVELPDAVGALGRNKPGYFHVRFQVKMEALADYAVVAEDITALEAFAETVTYSMDHQEGDGSFAFEPPAELVADPDYRPPSAGDLASGVAFFAKSMGLGLLALEQSPWFTTHAAAEPYRNTLDNQSTAISQTLDWLLTQEEVLAQYDAAAPNRLLFDALAYHTLGTYLQRPDALQVAETFMMAALALVDEEAGYFIEGGGWDSSYNGVAMMLAMELYSVMEEAPVALVEAIESATAWEICRIDEQGEISTQGNTRVYPGGEEFLGAEKGVDYAKIVKALYYFGHLTQEAEATQLGDRVLEFYLGG